MNPWTVARPLSVEFFLGKNPEAGCHFLLQGIFVTRVSNPSLPHGQAILYHRATWEAPPCRILFPGGAAGKESACSAGDPGLIPESGRSPGEGIGNPPKCSWASLVVQLVKNLPAMREAWV